MPSLSEVMWLTGLGVKRLVRSKKGDDKCEFVGCQDPERWAAGGPSCLLADARQIASYHAGVDLRNVDDHTGPARGRE